MKKLALSALALLLLGLASCAQTEENEVEPPRFHLADLRFLEGGAFEQRLQIDLRVVNPNNFDISLEGLSFQLEVNGASFADGASNQEVTLPRLGDVKVPVTATTTLVDLVRQALLLGKTGEVSYRIDGLAFVTQGLGSKKVPFESEGQLKLLPEGDHGRTLVPTSGSSI